MRTIEEFISKYARQSAATPITKIIEKWGHEVSEALIERFLNTKVGHGIFVSEILMNPNIHHDGVSKDLLKGFAGLMKEKVNTYAQVHDYLMKAAEKGPE